MKKCPLKHFGGHSLKICPRMRALLQITLARVPRSDCWSSMHSCSGRLDRGFIRREFPARPVGASRVFIRCEFPARGSLTKLFSLATGCTIQKIARDTPDFFLELSPPRAICQVDTRRENVTRPSPASSGQTRASPASSDPALKFCAGWFCFQAQPG